MIGDLGYIFWKTIDRERLIYDHNIIWWSSWHFFINLIKQMLISLFYKTV